MDSRSIHAVYIRTNGQNEADPRQIPQVLAMGGDIQSSAAEEKEHADFIGRFRRPDGTYIHVYSSDHISIGRVTLPVASRRETVFPYAIHILCGQEDASSGTDWWHSARLTCRDKDGTAFLPAEDPSCGTALLAEKLAAYEDAESDGRILHLPCSRQAWTLQPSRNGFVPCPYTFQTMTALVEAMEAGLFGKTVFATKEEALAASRRTQKTGRQA